MYHCPRGKVIQHPSGFDFCQKCGKQSANNELQMVKEFEEIVKSLPSSQTPTQKQTQAQTSECETKMVGDDELPTDNEDSTRSEPLRVARKHQRSDQRIEHEVKTDDSNSVNSMCDDDVWRRLVDNRFVTKQVVTQIMKKLLLNRKNDKDICDMEWFHLWLMIYRTCDDANTFLKDINSKYGRSYSNCNINTGMTCLQCEKQTTTANSSDCKDCIAVRCLNQILYDKQFDQFGKEIEKYKPESIVVKSVECVFL